MDKNYIKSLKNDLLENGMVSESLPEYLNSKGLSNVSFRELTKSNRDSSPMTIYLSKKDGGNRTIYLPNPVSYQQCVNTVFKDKNILEKIINKIENNRFSHSKILWEDGLFNIPIKGNKSKYIDSKRDKMFLSVGKKYSLKYDIEKFYDNIYTHYLPVGLIGFDNALEMYRNHIPQSTDYKYMCNIDKDIRNMCNAETKGIVTGPFISRIFSELLQSEIDKEIFEKTGCENFRRFVDDTEMYLKTLDEAEKNIVILKNIFQRYKLYLKMEKTEIKQIPYIDFSSLKEILNIRINKIKGKAGWYFASQDDFFETIYKAEELERNNNTGALKYILKILNNKNYEYGINTKFDQKNKSFLYLLNYIIVYPRYAKEILKIVDIHIKYIEESKDILNNFLRETIDNRQELVCLYIIQILIKNDLEIDYTIIENYLDRNDGNEILRATFIKYLCIKNEDGRYNEKINGFKDSLKETNGINFRLEDWLSKYVLYFHDYISDNECTNENNFFENMKLYKNNDIKFIDFDVL